MPFPAAAPTTSDDLLMGNGVVAGRCPTCGREAKRTPEQNAGLHAVLTDIHKQMEWGRRAVVKGGMETPPDGGWMRATGRR